MEAEGPSSKPGADDSSGSAPELAMEPTFLLQEDQPTPEVTPGVVSLVAALMHDVLSSLDVFVVPAPDLPEAEPITESTSVVVTELVTLMLNAKAESKPEVEVEVAATDEVGFALVSPGPEVVVEAVGALQVLAIVPPSEVGLLTSHGATSSLPSAAGLSTSQVLVPLGAPDAGEHMEYDESLPPLVVKLENIQLLAHPLSTVEMEATVMEMHHRVGEFTEVSLTSVLDLRLEIGTRCFYEYFALCCRN